MRSLVFLVLGAAAASAQPFSAGLKVGLPLNDFINTVQSGSFKASSYTNRYIVGATAQLNLPLGLAIEGDALYRHFNYQSVTTVVDAVTSAYATSNAWEFPLLLKYRFPSHIVRPYVSGGVAWDTIQGLTQTINSTLAPSHTTTMTTSNPAELAHTTTMGIVFGAGLEVKALIIRVSPEIRYTRWTNQHFTLANALSSNQNQAEFLVGITF